MAQTAVKPKLTTFHATMAVTRIEEWCVDAGTPEEARELLASGQGYRCHVGDQLNVELTSLND